ncbi:MAG: MoxR family ATPase [Elusimicrobiota bacterium]|nr:MoxR family ATPase [Elusimicrobiota bacterium]
MSEKKDLKLASKLKESRLEIIKEMREVIVGQENVIDEILLTFFSRGHALIVGVPGLAKTLLVSTLSEILDLRFSRIQFTPDLMPSDILGYEILQEDLALKTRKLEFVWGPVFSNIVLADEINRTPPKTQSALLQSMQEQRVTVFGKTRDLPEPFMVLATQNPIEQEGTYPLPEAQLDRFFMQINVDYPNHDQEIEIVEETTGLKQPDIKKILTCEDIMELQEIVRKVPVAKPVLEFAIKLTRLSRPGFPHSPEFTGKWISWGAGPRASQSLVLAAKANCLLHGRFAVSREDIIKVAFPVLRHRIVLNFQAQAEGITPDEIIKRLLDYN